jgi:hypothetical protein
MSKKIGIGLLVGLSIVGILIFVVMKILAPAEKPVTEDTVPTPTEALPTVPDSVKVSLTAKNDNHVVLLGVVGLPDGTQSVEYELTYTTAAGLPRGVLGKIAVNGQSQVKRDDITLGTCSSGKCVFDQGVSAVSLTLKINSDKGSSVFSKSYSL